MIEQELEQIKEIYALVTEFLVNYSFQLVGAIVIFVIGLFVAKKLSAYLFKFCTKHNLDVTLSRFLSNGLKIIILVMVGIISLGKIGISVTPFVAAIGAASLGAGLAFQGLLSNYGAGFTIIVTRPFVVGDTITIQGITGIVKDVTLGMTYLTNEEEETISIPNKYIVGEILHHSEQRKLVHSSIGVAYDSDMEKTLEIINQALQSVPQISQEKAPQIGIEEFADSAINVGIRYWVPTDQYYQVKYHTNFLVFQALQKAGIEIPFPQQEVKLLNPNDPY